MPSVSAPAPSDAPPFRPTYEARFAVVMYGGVSLAVYISGVVQELFNLTRATAPAQPTDSDPDRVALAPQALSGTERVYRKLGQVLHWRRDQIRQENPDDGDPVRVRFVLDILSGSSAGGINGILLAKALANNQEVGLLKRLWIEDGDIAQLVNDSGSAKGATGVKPRRPPESVLNGDRLYSKALEALTAMDGDTTGPAETRSLYVDELDLWITATDLPGLALPLQLSGRSVVWERRHKNVFHFRYGTARATGQARNDFGYDDNPFLAFAARSTSSFPFAFEPVMLTDVDRVVDHFKLYRQRGLGSESPRWDKFFGDHVRENEFFRERAFADGGYLDNKPFSYAVDALAKRRAVIPVDRKLVYVEPDPSNPEDDPGPTGRPGPFENVQAALVSLPRSEPIREDLERVLRRNRDIGRRDLAARVIEDALARDIKPPEALGPVSGDEWRELDLADMVGRWGLAYGAYHRLKVASVVGDLARASARAAGFVEDSGEGLAIRYLLEEWVAGRYPEFREAGAADRQPTQAEFLLRFDVEYRLRRLDFVLERLDELLRRDDRAEEILANAPTTSTDPRWDSEETLRTTKARLSKVFVTLRNAEQELQSPRSALGAAFGRESSIVSREELLFVLAGPMTLGRRGEPVRDPERVRARMLLDRADLPRRLEEVEQAVANTLEAVIREASTETRDALGGGDAGSDDPRAALFHFYELYESYDVVLFTSACGETGEFDRIEVVRISSQDATSLIDERRDRKAKLAGVGVKHFGGFFEEAWRRNDIMWGRLDAAEVLIDTLLPAGHPCRDEWLEEAQEEIIREELLEADSNAVISTVVSGLLAQRRNTGLKARLGKIADRNEAGLADLVESSGTEVKPALQSALTAALTPAQLRTFLAESFRLDTRLEPRKTLHTLGRATRVVGRVLDSRSVNPAVKKPAAWLLRIGAAVWGLVEVATPRSWPRIIYSYWRALLILIGVLLVLVGALFGVDGAAKAGWVVLAVVLGASIAVWAMSDVLRRRYSFVTLAGVTVVVAIFVLAGRELLDLIDDPPRAWNWASERYENADTWPERAWDWLGEQF